MHWVPERIKRHTKTKYNWLCVLHSCVTLSAKLNKFLHVAAPLTWVCIKQHDTAAHRQATLITNSNSRSEWRCALWTVFLFFFFRSKYSRTEDWLFLKPFLFTWKFLTKTHPTFKTAFTWSLGWSQKTVLIPQYQIKCAWEIRHQINPVNPTEGHKTKYKNACTLTLTVIPGWPCVVDRMLKSNCLLSVQLLTVTLGDNELLAALALACGLLRLCKSKARLSYLRCPP